MNLLILGGTVFLGRALVDAALAGGHTLTLFNRGQTHPQLYPQVEKIVGQRDGGLASLEGRKWDAVIDTCGYLPRVVRQSAQLLSGSVERYVFISTISVYADASQPGVDEDGPVNILADESVEEITGETYGGLKALCEKEAMQCLPERALVIRPGLIVGPYDPSDRFTYWPWRVAQGGEVLSPGKPGRRVQYIDVRDLAEWILRLVEVGQTGIYNADGPIEPIPMMDVLQVCKTASQSDASFTWVSEKFLQEQHVQEWIEMPLWIPESDPANAGFFAFSNDRALASGLTFRPLEQTLRATLDWLETRPADHTWRAGISRSREAELLGQWRANLSIV